MTMRLRTIVTAAAAAVLVASAPGWGQVNYNVLYSVDLGSDLDLSDPTDGGTTSNNFLDCGDIYLVQPSFPHYPPTVDPLIQGQPQPATLYKDDNAPTNWWQGYPFSPNVADQPDPVQIGQANVEDYELYFDLDAEDQANFDWIGMQAPILPESLVEIRPLTVSAQQALGIYHMPKHVYMSFEDDGPNGWAVSGNIPTTFPPDHAYEVFADRLDLTPTPGPVTPPGPWTNEHNLALSPNPFNTPEDDDVDALDLHADVEPLDNLPDYIYFERYFSADHEANMGLDPGSVYLTTNTPGQNRVLAFDQVVNFGLPDPQLNAELDPDVDAFELLTITPEAYKKLFDDIPLDISGQPIVNNNILMAIFSVDQDDPDTPAIDESGGLNPNVIYLTNLIGQFTRISEDYDEDIDALAVPEPATLVLLALGGLVIGSRRRRG